MSVFRAPGSCREVVESECPLGYLEVVGELSRVSVLLSEARKPWRCGVGRGQPKVSTVCHSGSVDSPSRAECVLSTVLCSSQSERDVEENLKRDAMSYAREELDSSLLGQLLQVE